MLVGDVVKAKKIIDADEKLEQRKKERKARREFSYETLCEQLKSLTEDVPHKIANFANASALLYDELFDINWAGFYFYEEASDKLVLGPFQGKPACIEIPVGKGVCGTAFAAGETIVVPDVHQFPGHIACDSASASEIVVPLKKDGKVFGVLDIDSPIKKRFDDEDKAGLEKIAEIIEKF